MGINFSCSCQLHPLWEIKQETGLQYRRWPARQNSAHIHPCMQLDSVEGLVWARRLCLASFDSRHAAGSCRWDMAQNILVQANVGGLPSDLIFSHRLSVCRMGLVHDQQTLQPKPNHSSQHIIHSKIQFFLVIPKVSSWEGQDRMDLWASHGLWCSKLADIYTDSPQIHCDLPSIQKMHPCHGQGLSDRLWWSFTVNTPYSPWLWHKARLLQGLQPDLGHQTEYPSASSWQYSTMSFGTHHQKGLIICLHSHEEQRNNTSSSFKLPTSPFFIALCWKLISSASSSRGRDQEGIRCIKTPWGMGNWIQIPFCDSLS